MNAMKGKLVGRKHAGYVPNTDLIRTILPLAVGDRFTYELPEGMRQMLQVGMRVTVQFGRGRKVYSAIVDGMDVPRPEGVRLKRVLSQVDRVPVVRQDQLALWQEIASHYECTIGEVMIAAMPRQLLMSSETRVHPTAALAEATDLSAKDVIALQVLQERGVMDLHAIGELLDLKDPMQRVIGWVDRGWVSIEERITDRFKPRSIEHVSLAEEPVNEATLHALFDELKNAPRQLELLMRFIELSQCLTESPIPVERKRLQRAANATSQTVQALVRKGAIKITTTQDQPLANSEGNGRSINLSTAQRKALEEVSTQFQERPVCLLHGVTSSGKTEIYVKLILEQFDAGKQVLYLVPEIALTTQLIGRLRQRLGDRVLVYHSRSSDRERAQLWMDLLQKNDRPMVMLGTRSALFLPFDRLGLVIVDEEHDPSFKQQDPAPRYNARDMAIVLGTIHRCHVLLGGATPSVETLYNAESGKFGYARLADRHGNVLLPEVITVDLREALKKRQMQGHFSPALLEHIRATLARNEQVILFQNRRGYVPVWQCADCAWVPGCDHCDVSLTYHKRDHGLRCHYCGRSYRPPTSCGQCGGTHLRMLGLGTELIEEELGQLLPDARISRLDQDTTRGRNAYARILDDFEQGASDILVGTQMVTKGLDLEHVTLVGIMNADALLRFPDLRAHERAFQLMAQVAGRAGRRNRAGKVLIQTYEPAHPVIQFVLEHNVLGMHEREIEQRKAHLYPPFSRLVKITFTHRREELVHACATAFANDMQGSIGDRTLGPEIPYIARVRDMHIRHVLLKLRKGRYTGERAQMTAALVRLEKNDHFRPVRIIVDVDPV